MKFPNVFYVEITYSDSETGDITNWPELRTPLIYCNRAKSFRNVKEIHLKYDYLKFITEKNQEYVMKAKGHTVLF